MIFSIDPGTTESGWVYFDAGKVRECGISPNDEVLRRVQIVGGYVQNGMHSPVTLCIETMQANYAATVGASVIDTLIWIGRFKQAWHRPNDVMLISRQHVKQSVCGNVKAKDSGVRQALIDLLGAPGTKKAPGPTYGVTSHAWSALAVAVAATTRRMIA